LVGNDIAEGGVARRGALMAEAVSLAQVFDGDDNVSHGRKGLRAEAKAEIGKSGNRETESRAKSEGPKSCGAWGQFVKAHGE
jgi:hypothetical protein